MAREVMAFTGLSAQELVNLARSAYSAAGGTASAIVRAERAAAMGIEIGSNGGGRRPDTTAANIAEAVMGSEAWNTYKHSEYKSMHGPRKPQSSKFCDKRTK